MSYHLEHFHKEIKLTDPKSAPEPSHDDFHRRPAPYANIFSLRTKTDRKAMFQTTIPGWVEHKNPLDFHSDKAQRIHKAIFEQMVLDLVPFHEVNKPGFLRTYAHVVPNFEVASDKYYRSLLDPTYDKIRYASICVSFQFMFTKREDQSPMLMNASFVFL